jgi:hypothetical protein
MGRGNRLYLRSFQIKACDRRSLPTTELFAEAERLATEATDVETWAVFVFAVQTIHIRARSLLFDVLKLQHFQRSMRRRRVLGGERNAGTVEQVPESYLRDPDNEKDTGMVANVAAMANGFTAEGRIILEEIQGLIEEGHSDEAILKMIEPENRVGTLRESNTSGAASLRHFASRATDVPLIR